MNFRIGFGYDVHRFTEGNYLTLGGIAIPHNKGILAHSDGDVLIHAICDAILGAANLRDIGYHFPDTADEFKGIDSKIILQKTLKLIKDKGFSIVNIDSTVCLQKPKIKSYISEMQKALSDVMKTSVDNISIKATTTEKMGFVGNEEGISAYCVCLIEKR